MKHLLIALTALLLIITAATFQANSYANVPPTSTTVPKFTSELAAVRAETSCGDLRIQYNINHNVWKGGIKDGHDELVEPHRQLMVAILRRLAWLERRNKCGG
jgi:hypothetical protein